MTWWRALPELLRDAVGALAIILIFVIAQQIYGDGGSLPRAVAIVVVMGVALTVRRRWPAASYAAGLLTVVFATTGMEFLAVVSYTLVAYRERVRPAPVAGISALALVIGHLDYWPELVVDQVAGDLILIAGISVLPVVLGQAVRNARRTTTELTRRNAELVVLRQQAADHAVETERFRIARELHDVVAHHVSAMTVRARAGHHVAERDPQAAVDALGYVAEAGSEALTAMGSFVGTLRGEVAAGGRDELVPQPTLEDLPDLLESFRRTGLVVHEDLHTSGVSVARALGLNAYRIVEEALTNAIRHGAAERVWVQMWFDGEDLHLQVDDNGRGLDGGCTPTGHGLVGMAERAELHGGAMVFGPSPRGGCRVEATLPTGHAGSQAPPSQVPAGGPASVVT
ncbi:sensor histidine kinase [Blastococcus sp. VKM Ac-2987]|uniref:sensor histidine kinase n=1 Tax=Blastococcus sp. VKM Ac-2987 TaxID=3004141 RepID=UPI0022AB8914|nr:histidine kinase [Blastococcus sp. VKM Ac-2987]MCZ2857462.1 histidine kinase [Blastococcus sp. VKM Ac-2987]